MSNEEEPKLALPGAGLPWLELFLTKLLFSLRRYRGTRQTFDAQFTQELERIRKLIGRCDNESGSLRVLIKRMPGLEDSSRYWSVWMTLEHLRIVHNAIAFIIGELVRDVSPPGAADTATVKPSSHVGPDVVAAFEESCEALTSLLASSPNLNTRARFSHPWFGPLNAAGWHSLASLHLRIHRIQIERILADARKPEALSN